MTQHIPEGLPDRIQHFIDGQFVDSVDGDTFDVLNPTDQRGVRPGRLRASRPTSISRSPRRKRAFDEGPVAEAAAASAVANPAQGRGPRRGAGQEARRAGDLGHGPADHPGTGPGAARGGELPLLRRPDRRPDRRHLQGPRPAGELRQPQAQGRRRADHPLEHPVHARVVEARPGAGHRQHRGSQAGRVHPAVGVALGGDLPGGRRARRRLQPRQRLRGDRRRRPGEAP